MRIIPAGWFGKPVWAGGPLGGGSGPGAGAGAGVTGGGWLGLPPDGGLGELGGLGVLGFEGVDVLVTVTDIESRYMPRGSHIRSLVVPAARALTRPFLSTVATLLFWTFHRTQVGFGRPRSVPVEV